MNGNISLKRLAVIAFAKNQVVSLRKSENDLKYRKSSISPLPSIKFPLDQAPMPKFTFYNKPPPLKYICFIKDNVYKHTEAQISKKLSIF